MAGFRGRNRRGNNGNNSIRGRTKYYYRNGQTERVVQGALGASYNLGDSVATANFTIPWNRNANEDLYENQPDFTVTFVAGGSVADIDATRTRGFFQISPAGKYDIHFNFFTETSGNAILHAQIRKVETGTDDILIPAPTFYGGNVGGIGQGIQVIAKDLDVSVGDVFYCPILNIRGTEGVQAYLAIERLS